MTSGVFAEARNMDRVSSSSSSRLSSQPSPDMACFHSEDPMVSAHVLASELLPSLCP